MSKRIWQIKDRAIYPLNLTKDIGLLVFSLLLSACSTTPQFTENYTKARSLDNFNDYVDYLKNKAIKAGVSSSIVNAQQNIYYLEKAIEQDRKQAKKSKPTNSTLANKTSTRSAVKIVKNSDGVTRYLQRVLPINKVDVAEKRYQQYAAILTQASNKFAVQKEYLLALWGMESSFGYYQGKYDVLSALATLAFEGRREKLFSNEFIASLQMLQQGYIKRDKMRGSWAGAMGQTQFMPSSYLKYAVDMDQDGSKDIWQTSADVFASIANYLHTVGWNNKVSWGVEVVANRPLAASLIGVQTAQAKSLVAWQKLGITMRYHTPFEQQKWYQLAQQPLWLIMPDGEKGRAFLVSNNFKTLLDWNRSYYFAISIGAFADKISQRLALE